MRNLATQKDAAAQKENKIQEVVEALTTGTFTKISKAVHHFGVPYDTLRCQYLRLNQSRSDAHIHEQLLTKAEEETICKWLKYMGMTSHPISKETLHVKVGNISTVLQEKCQQTGELQIPSRKWIYKFLDRQPDLQLKRPTSLDPKRTELQSFCGNTSLSAP
jgi:hypothetical protein